LVLQQCKTAGGRQAELQEAGCSLAAGEVVRMRAPSPWGRTRLVSQRADLASLTYILDGSGAADWKLSGSS